MAGSTGRLRRVSRPVLVAVAAVIVLTGSGLGALALRAGQDAQEIVLGALAVTDGPPAPAGEDAFRGIDLAVAETGGEIAGKAIRVVRQGTNGTPDQAEAQARELVEVDGADLVIGPMTAEEGLRVKEFAATVPGTTFIDGASAAQDLTLRDPVANVFRFTPDAVQWQAGLGSYAFHDLGFPRVVVIAEDAHYPYAQVGGFMSEFCTAGGHVPEKIWVAPGTTDFAETISRIPANVDAIFLALDSAPALAFLDAYVAAGGAKPILAGSQTIDRAMLSSTSAGRSLLFGVASAGPIASANADPAWLAFVAEYTAAYPDAGEPSLYAFLYYTSAKAVLLGLERVDGDLSDGQSALMAALGNLSFYTPSGPVRLDQNNQAIANIFVTVVDVDPNGTLYEKIVRVTPNVNQTLGLTETQFLAQGTFGRDNPSCL